jgi:hypothetical protein
VPAINLKLLVARHRKEVGDPWYKVPVYNTHFRINILRNKQLKRKKEKESRKRNIERKNEEKVCHQGHIPDVLQ